MTLLSQQAANVLQATLDQPIGWIVRCNTQPGTASSTTPAQRAMQILNRFRKELGNPDFQNIQIRLSRTDPNNELWLINRKGTGGA